MSILFSFFFALFFLPRPALALSCEALTRDQANELWRDDKLYFLPKIGITSFEWNGDVFLRKETQCCSVNEISDVKLHFVIKPCEGKFLSKANRKYVNVDNFKKFKRIFLNCLKKNDRACLAPLISRNFQSSFGFDGMGDLRDLALKNWKNSDLKKMATLIERGIVDENETRTFPPKPDNDGMGWRGGFKKTKDGWLLEYFLAGD